MDSSILKKILTAPPLAHLDIPQFMIFIENEPINARAYLNLMSKKLNLPIALYDTADNAIYDIERDLFEDKIYYILNDESILKKQDYIPYLNTIGKFVVVGFDGVKISDGFQKDNAQFIYTFEKADTKTLISYIRKKMPSLNVTENTLTRLIECSDHRLSQINNELDKLSKLTRAEQESYFMLPDQFPDLRTIDNMTVWLMIINKNSSFIPHINILINSAVQSMLALYTMARKKFVATNDKYYAKLMLLCFKTHSSIIDGTSTSENAIKKFVIDLMWG